MSDERRTEQLTIGGLARATGVATSALRYWEELGLLPAPARVSGQRRYPASAVELVGLILVLRDIGFTLRELKTDRKSTRLNSSHSQISYAVFCLTKKKDPTRGWR